MGMNWICMSDSQWWGQESNWFPWNVRN